MTIELGVLIAIIGCAIGVAGFIKGIKKDTKDDVKDESNQNVRLAEFKVTLDSIKNSTDDTRIDVKEINRNINDMNTRLVLVENSNKKAHERIDNLKQKFEKLR